MQRATSTTSGRWILQRVASDFFRKATSASSNGWIFASSNFCNEQLLQPVTSKICYKQLVILQRVPSNKWISTSNEQGVKSYAWSQIGKFFCNWKSFLIFKGANTRFLEKWLLRNKKRVFFKRYNSSEGV